MWLSLSLFLTINARQLELYRNKMSSFSLGMKIWYYAYNKSVKNCLPVDALIVVSFGFDGRSKYEVTELIFLHETCFWRFDIDFIWLHLSIKSHHTTLYYHHLVNMIKFHLRHIIKVESLHRTLSWRSWNIFSLVAMFRLAQWSVLLHGTTLIWPCTKKGY